MKKKQILEEISKINVEELSTKLEEIKMLYDSILKELDIEEQKPTEIGPSEGRAFDQNSNTSDLLQENGTESEEEILLRKQIAFEKLQILQAGLGEIADGLQIATGILGESILKKANQYYRALKKAAKEDPDTYKEAFDELHAQYLIYKAEEKGIGGDSDN